VTDDTINFDLEPDNIQEQDGSDLGNQSPIEEKPSVESKQQETPKKNLTPAERQKLIKELKAKKAHKEKPAKQVLTPEQLLAKKKSRKKIFVSLLLLVVLGLVGYFAYKYTGVFRASQNEIDTVNTQVNVVDSSSLDSDSIVEEENYAVDENQIEKNAEEVIEDNLKKSSKSSKPTNSGKLTTPCWLISYSSVAKKSNAVSNVEMLKSKGIKAGYYFMPDYKSDAKELYKIYVGPYTSKGEAQANLSEVSNLSPGAYVFKLN